MLLTSVEEVVSKALDYHHAGLEAGPVALLGLDGDLAPELLTDHLADDQSQAHPFGVELVGVL